MDIKFPVTDMKDFDKEILLNKGPLSGIQKTKLEVALDKCNHTMELVRTIVPILILIIQVIILFKI
jgi:hypothetical protein